jgi:hypothetical protein
MSYYMSAILELTSAFRNSNSQVFMRTEAYFFGIHIHNKLLNAYNPVFIR